jgi:hypothetical protein
MFTNQKRVGKAEDKLTLYDFEESYPEEYKIDAVPIRCLMNNNSGYSYSNWLRLRKR